jgi:hypothetical protein
MKSPGNLTALSPPEPDPMRVFPRVVLAAAVFAAPALAEPAKSDIELAQAKAKKEKKLVTLVFTQFG